MLKFLNMHYKHTLLVSKVTTVLSTHLKIESPTFDTYKDIIERQVFIGEDINRLKNGLLNALTLNNLVHVKTRILILLHEKQYTSLKETIKALRSSDVIIDAAKVFNGNVLQLIE